MTLVARAHPSSGPADTADLRVDPTRSGCGAIAVLIVTWNRWEMADRVLRALSEQDADRASMHIVIIDNASTDGTRERLHERWRADRLIENRTRQAHEPNFVDVSLPPSDPTQSSPRHPWGSLTIIRNGENLGGCGGFNTGLAFTAHVLDPALGVEGAWLVDDDVDLPRNALSELLRVMRADPTVGLVGSRTNDIMHRDVTIETTIYFDGVKGVMCPEPPLHHPRREAFERWVAPAGPDDPGGRVGKRSFAGVLDVDVASACSLLARWGAVTGAIVPPGRAQVPARRKPGQGSGVGFWDWRYFIYCDDADWSLRFARDGWRIVLNLDAVVYHTPWLMKLTPQRLYYAQRNAVWMIQKVLAGPRLRRVTRWWMRTLLSDAAKAATHRRLFHARIILKTIRDVIDNVAGKTAPEGPPKVDLDRAIAELGHEARVLVQVPHAPALDWARELVRHSGPRWTLLISNQVPGFEHGADASRLPPGIDAIVYAPRRLSKLRKQGALMKLRPRAVVVFDQSSDCPVLWPGWNLHIDSKAPGFAQVERESCASRAKLAVEWARTAIKAVRFSLTVRAPDNSAPYG